MPQARGPGKLPGTGHSPPSVPLGSPMLQMEHRGPGSGRDPPGEASALVLCVEPLFPGEPSRGFPETVAARSCHPVRKNEPASGKLVLFRRRYRRGRARSPRRRLRTQRQIPRGGKIGEITKSCSTSSSTFKGGNPGGAGTAGLSQPGPPAKADNDRGMADGPTCHRALRGPSPPVALCSPAGKHPVPCPLPPSQAARLTRWCCCTSHTCGAWAGWLGPGGWAARTGGSGSWAGRQVCHLEGEGRQTHQSGPTAAAGCLHARCLLRHALPGGPAARVAPG